MTTAANWDYIKQRLLKFKDDTISQSKRAIKKEVPKNELTRQEIQDTLIKLFNDTVSYIAAYWDNLDNAQRLVVKDIFSVIRDKVTRSFQFLNVSYKVPVSCLEKIDPLVLDEDLIVTETQGNLSDMAMSHADFFNLASKIMPQEFDGSPDKLQTFLDALTLLNQNSTNHVANAVAFVKTRLTGKARSIITTEATLADIINSLKNGIKGESSQLLTVKLLNHKQNHKDPTNYAAEIELLAEKLKMAFTSEGVPYEVAKKYATEHTVRSLSQNSISDRVKVVMEAGTYNTVQEAITKFISVNANSQGNTSNILYARHNRETSNFRNVRGRGQNYSRWQNFRGGRGQGRGRGNYGTRYEGNGRNFRQNHPTNSTRAVRTVTNDNAGNEEAPQRARLGDEM